MKTTSNLKIFLTRSQRVLKRVYYHSVKPSVVNLEGIKVEVSPDFSEPIKQSLYGLRYEYWELQLLRLILEPTDVVMEIGTGLGLLSAYCARKIGSNRIFTYEGNPEQEPYIRRTYALNDVNPKLEVCLIGRESGTESFYVSKDFWDASTVVMQDARQITVPVKSVNEVIQQHNPTFLIIDIEGGEYDLFQSIDLTNVKKVLIELHGRIGQKKIASVKQKLLDAGFQPISHVGAYGNSEQDTSSEVPSLEVLFLQKA
jgi:FkbM family methyltransferase